MPQSPARIYRRYIDGMAKWDGKIPFNAKGDQLHYPENWPPGMTWQDNRVYDGELVVDSMSRGRSAAYFEGTLTGRYVAGYPDGFPNEIAPPPFRVTIFMSDFMEMVRTGTIVRGRLLGYFTFSKRGANYGLRLYAPGAE